MKKIIILQTVYFTECHREMLGSSSQYFASVEKATEANEEMEKLLEERGEALSSKIQILDSETLQVEDLYERCQQCANNTFNNDRGYCDICGI